MLIAEGCFHVVNASRSRASKGVRVKTRKENPMKVRDFVFPGFIAAALLCGPAPVKAGEIADDVKEIRSDRRDIRHDRQDIREDTQEIRDLKEQLRNDRAAGNQDAVKADRQKLRRAYGDLYKDKK